MSGAGSGQDTPGEGSPGTGPERYPGPMVYAGFGMLNAICLLLGGFLGWLADRELGTLPLFMLIGLLAGAALGVVATRSEWRRYNRQG
jgi:Putative F0F1-ATPase subunit Ca2+/Mg2+ transporter